MADTNDKMNVVNNTKKVNKSRTKISEYELEGLGTSAAVIYDFYTEAKPGDLILSLETATLPENAADFEIIWITLAYMDKRENGGKPILFTPVLPYRISDVSAGTPYNGITNEMIFNSRTPRITEKLGKQIRALSKGHNIFVWNKDFTNRALACSMIGKMDNLVDVQEEVRWDMAIMRDSEDPTKFEYPQFDPKLPAWQEVLGRKPKLNEKVAFIRFVHEAIGKGGVRAVLAKMNEKNKGG